jgi:hypothetical protein
MYPNDELMAIRQSLYDLWKDQQRSRELLELLVAPILAARESESPPR